MGAGAFAGLVAAIIVCAAAGAPFIVWVLALIVGPVVGAVAVGMVS
jgi:hypothetical protein